MVLADLRRPRFARPAAGASGPEARAARPAAALLYDLALIAAGSFLIALSAQVAIPLPVSPVPVTGQTFGGLFVASVLPILRALTESDSAAFFWLDESGAIANFYAERFPISLSAAAALAPVAALAPARPFSPASAS